MKNIHKMMNKIIIEITFLIVLCIISFGVFKTSKIETIDEDFNYTDLEVSKERNYIGVNEFPVDSQIKLTVSNLSNTYEDYKVLLTSKLNLTEYEDCLKVKINDREYLLKDLKVADNYFLIDRGNMKANTKEILLYFAMDEEYIDIIGKPISFQFINDLSI